MSYSFTWTYITLFLLFLLLLSATVCSFVAPSLMNKNETASRLFYASGAVGIFIILLLFVFIPILYSTSEEMMDKKENVYFGWGTLILGILTILSIIAMIALLAYAITLVNSNARWVGVAGLASISTAFILYFIFSGLLLSFNYRVVESKDVIKEVIVEQPVYSMTKREVYEVPDKVIVKPTYSMMKRKEYFPTPKVARDAEEVIERPFNTTDTSSTTGVQQVRIY